MTIEGSLTGLDWFRIILGFCLGTAVTLLILQVTMSGTLFQGYLSSIESFQTSANSTR